MKKIIAAVLCLCMAFTIAGGAVAEDATVNTAQTQQEVNLVKPPLSGGFIQPWLYMSYTQADWDRELTELKKVGIDTLVMGDIATISQTDKWQFYYRSKLPEAANGTVYYDAITPLLKNCQKHGIKVYLGMGIDGRWWNADLSKDEDIEWFEWFTDQSVRIAQELYDTFKASYPDTFYGFYSVPEIWNHYAWRNPATRTKYADTLSAYFNTMIATIEKNDASMPLMFSPFSTPNKSWLCNKSQMQAFYTELFTKTNFRKIDAFCPMDNIGGGGMSLELLPEWTKAYYDAVKDGGDKLQFWSNCETFVQPEDTTENDKWGAADIGRYVKQIETVKPYVSKIFSFAYSHYFSPVNTVGGFHETFLEYIKTGILDQQAPAAPDKVKTTLSGGKVRLQWSGMYDNKGISRVNIYKDGVFYDYALAIKDDASGKTPTAPQSFTDKNSSADTTAVYEIEVIDCAGNVSPTKTRVEVKAGQINNNVVLGAPYKDIWDPEKPMGESAELHYMGDGNNDKSIDVKDALLALQVSVQLVEPTNYQKQVLDINKDKQITVVDALKLLQYSVHLHEYLL